MQGGPLDEKQRYLHWDDVRFRKPPNGLTVAEWWFATTMARRASAKFMPLRATDGTQFRFSNVDPVQHSVHLIDQQASGQILADDLVTNLRTSDRYLVSSLTEEAITSSQLEGASTTRRVAKELLATGRKPRDRSEQMIVNNFQAMLFAQELANEPLTPDAVLELHRIVTEDTLDDPGEAGRLQTRDDDRVRVWWGGTLLHTPPPAEELPVRLTALCQFANEEIGQGFIHPVVRSIILHFWLAYDHPFADGNGRTARALFYWSMLRHGYWLSQYLSVSAILRAAPAQYVRSYLMTETDDGDLTYFVIYQLRVLERALQSLQNYLARKIAETREIESLIHGSPLINNRQLLIVRDALRDPGEPFTIRAQQNRHRVTYESARTDLLNLVALGLFVKTKVGNKHVFRSRPDLPERLRALGQTADL